VATFNKPKNLNGAELLAELKVVGLDVNLIRDNSDGTISFEVNNEELASEIVLAHNGTTVAPELTIEQKLASVGLSLPDLKAALGL
jgi:hypothetical protein